MTSTVLTLVILPFFYTLVDDVAQWIRWVWQASASGRQVTAAGSSSGLPAPSER